MLRYGVLVVIVFVFAGCSTLAAPDNHDADVKAIKQTEAAWAKAAGSKDLDQWLAYYSDDGSVLLPNAPAITGKDNLRAALQPMVADPNFALSFQSTRVDVARSGELGYSQGTYSMTLSDPKTSQPVTDRGKYVTVFKKQADGSWKAVEDMISSDMPAPDDSH